MCTKNLTTTTTILNMKKTILIIGAIVMMAGFSTRVMAQLAPTTGTNTLNLSNDASAMLLVPLTLTKTGGQKGLNFGTINLGTGTGGAVTVSPTTELATVTTGSLIISTSNFANKQKASVAKYTVSGTYGATYSLFSDPTITLNNAGATGINSITVKDLKVLFANNLAQTEADVANSGSTLDASGSDSFKIGGTLVIVSGQAGGLYNGTFNVAVDYN